MRIMFSPWRREELVVDSSPFIRDSGGGTNRGTIPDDVLSEILCTRVWTEEGRNPPDVWVME